MSHNWQLIINELNRLTRDTMASATASQPRQGSSTDHTSDLEEVDIEIIVGEVDGPRLRELLRLNQLKVVPIRSEDGNFSPNKLKTEVIKLQEMLASRTRALDEANDAIERMRHRFEEADERSETLQLSLATQQAVIDELENERHHELENKCRAAKETLKDLRSQLEEARAQTVTEKVAKDAVSKEKVDLQGKFQEERRRRSNEIIALKNENERLIGDKMRFAVLVQQLTKCTELPVSVVNLEEMLTPGVLKQLSDHVERLMKARAEDQSELVWSRNFANQMESLLRTRRRFSNSASFSVSTANQVGETMDSQSTNDGLEEVDSIVSTPTPSISVNFPPTPLPRSPSPSLLAPLTPPPEQQSPEKPALLEPTPLPPEPVSLETASPPTIVTLGPPSPSKNLQEVSNATTTLNENQTSAAAGRTPIIFISLSQDTQDQQIPTSVPPQKQQPTTSAPPPPRQRHQPPAQNLQQNRAPTNPARNSKQFTEFVISTKRHGFDVHSNPTKLSCLCGKEYKTQRGLRVHVRKMTTEWKFKCSTCQQYFFYQSELNKHLSSTSCGGDSFDLDAFLQIPPQQSQRLQPSTSFTAKATKRAELRKLQQDILKRKKHTPWLSKMGTGTVQGSWYCSCMSKFKTKERLLYHVQYWSKEWKFQCEHCNQKFFSFSDLRKHLKNSHKISYALGEYSVGCHLCGKMFRNRSEFFVHKKLMHNIHGPKKRQNGENVNGFTSQPRHK